MSRSTSQPSSTTAGRSRRGLRRRGPQATAALAGGRGWACPDCGLATRDPVAVRLGFCVRCHDFTGMCGAGRKIVCPDMMSLTDWHTPCTSLGALPWQISQDAGPRDVLLCAAHDAQLRAGRAAWITSAVPLVALARP